MPYIKKDDRERLHAMHYSVRADRIQTAGELNYAISLLLKTYTEVKGFSYQTMNDVVGAVEGAKVEYQRRIVAPYENKKIQENGDVYTDEERAFEEAEEAKEAEEIKRLFEVVDGIAIIDARTDVTKKD